jgi:hypothetical protein
MIACMEVQPQHPNPKPTMRRTLRFAKLKFGTKRPWVRIPPPRPNELTPHRVQVRKPLGPVAAGCGARPDVQLLPRDQTTTMGGRQLASGLGECLVRHHHRLITAVVQRAGHDLLHGGDTDGLRQPLALDRHARAVPVGDEVHSIVAASGGVSDAPTPDSKLRRNEFFKLDTRHLIDIRHTGRRGFQVTSSLSFHPVAVPPRREPQQNEHRQEQPT